METTLLPTTAENREIPVNDLQDLANLDVLDVSNGNHEQALVDLQLSLAAYTQVVAHNLCDSIPKLVYAQLVAKVMCVRRHVVCPVRVCDTDSLLISC